MHQECIVVKGVRVCVFERPLVGVWKLTGRVGVKNKGRRKQERWVRFTSNVKQVLRELKGDLLKLCHTYFLGF